MESRSITPVRRRPRAFAVAVRIAAACLAGLLATGAQARVTKIEIDARKDLPPVAGQIPYEQIAGRAHGQLDPGLPLNAIITDLELAKGADGLVRYETTFVITKPKDMGRASGLLWHDVPNRGNHVAINEAERGFGDIGLASAWQGDNAGNTAVRATMGLDASERHWLRLPVARNPDGSDVTGLVFGRIVNRSGTGSQPLIVQTNPVPYMPLTTDTARSRLVSRAGEAMDGKVIGETAIPATEWSWGACPGEEPRPAERGPRICLKHGFNASLLYQVVYPSKDPYVLGIGFAAWRDVGSFFRYAAADDAGTPNPLASKVTHSIGRGNSQSGNFLRGWLHLAFNQDEAKRQVHDGMWPIIAGRRIALNFRWAQPDGVLELYQAGSEGPQWWASHPDEVRGLPAAGILDRCEATRTCPKIMEHFGAAEIWALKLGPEWIGTGADHDIRLPANVRRYYIPGSTHGGTNVVPGGNWFNASLDGSLLAAPSCPGNNWGVGILPANPVPHVHTVNALRVHFRNWVLDNVEPPPSRYPMLNDRGSGTGRAQPDLVEPTKAAMGFPSIPGLLGERAGTIPEAGFINPLLDYDWGPRFNYTDVSGVPSNAPPPIKQVIRMLVPRVDTDGNEVGGVPVVLVAAPLGTYLGWNVTAGGARPFHEGQICNYAGGMIPFASTTAQRIADGDPRPSLEERYGDHAGYVAAVRKAAGDAVSERFLLPEDADILIGLAERSGVLPPRQIGTPASAASQALAPGGN